MPAWGRLAILGAGVTAVGWAAIFVRLADEAPALTIAAYRLLFGTLIIGAYFGVRWAAGRERLPRRRDWPLIGLSGTFLALHFWTWFASLERTSVASSVVIVTMQPLIGALLAFVAFRERPVTAEYIGLALAACGLVVIAGGDLLEEGVRLQGDLLAFAGAVFVAAYMTVGRRMRADTGAIAYSTSVYAVAAVVLWTLVAIVRPDVGPFGAGTWTWLVLLGLLPQIVGHTIFNWSLGHLRVVTVGLAILGEPVVSTVLAIPILDEQPPAAALIGGAFILTGVAVGVVGAQRAAGRAPVPAPA